jgi:PAS domain S-box-containing protein
VPSDLLSVAKDLSSKLETICRTAIRNPRWLRPRSVLRKTDRNFRRESDRALTALKFSGVAVWNWNIADDIVEWSGSVEELFGVAAPGVANYSALCAHIHPEDWEAVNAGFKAARRSGATYSVEFRVIRPDGETRWLAGSGSAVLDRNGATAQLAGVYFPMPAAEAAQRKLEASERKLRELSEAMPQIVWTANAAGEFEYYNSMWYQVTGLSNSSVPTAQDLRSVVFPEDWDRWLRVWSRALASGQPYQIEYRVWDVSRQEYRWHLGKAVAARDSSGEVTQWFGTCTDTHERKTAEIRLNQNESMLRKREQQLSLIFETGAVGDWTWDIAADEVRAHPTVWAFYGAPEMRCPVPSSWFASRQHPEDSERINRELQEALDGNRPLDIEFRILRPDNSVRWIISRGVVVRDEHGTPIQAYGLKIDITERKLAELKVKESERQLREQADAMPQIVWTSKPDGSVDYYNNNWYEYTGERPDSLAEWFRAPFIHPDDLGRCLDACTRGFAGGVGFEIEARLKRHDQSYRWHLARCLPFCNQRGIVLRWFGTNTDVHEQKTEKERLEAEVQARTEELRRSLAKVETVLKEVNHRVKNNLQVISSLLCMQSDILDDPTAVAALRESQQRVYSMALIHDRLCSSRTIEELNFGEYAETLIHELFHGYSSSASKVISCLNLAPVTLTIDQAIPCGLILNELVTNALKYAYPDGRAGEIRVDLSASEAGEVALTVRDHGVGLPVSVDWKNSKSLGLPIVDLLTQQIGGKLTVERSPGAMFTVKFAKVELLETKAASAA